jgi:hypothetical protein
MKIKSYKMAIIPFEYVPHNVIFRFDGEWWRRITGSTEQAEAFIEQDNNYTKSKIIHKNELVVLNKSSLERNISYAFIFEEFDLNADGN